MQNEDGKLARPEQYSERGYTWPMTVRQRGRILGSTSPDMRAVFYQAEKRAARALGVEHLFTKSAERKRGRRARL